MSLPGDQEFSAEDVRAALRAEEDQRLMAVGVLANVVATYYSCLRQLGFERQDAFDLTRDYQQALFDAHSMSQGDSGDD